MANGFDIGDLAYCTNVHPGESVEEIMANLDRFVGPVRQKFASERLNVGLWISNKASYALNDEAIRSDLKQHLLVNQLSIQSINGFPFSNFHKNVVKEAVYQPDWSDPTRLMYTISLASFLANMLGEGSCKGTISTLPLGLRRVWSRKKQEDSVNNLILLVSELKKIEERTGKHIQVCMEMEPACVLEKTDQIVSFFASDLESNAKRQSLALEDVYRYLGVCFDVCHQAVMFEDIHSSMAKIAGAGIDIGKIQLSSALLLVSDQLEDIRRQLSIFSEPRYLHQTTVRSKDGTIEHYDDLSKAFEKANNLGEQQWRVHYHVPLQLETINDKGLSTTRFATDEVFSFLAANRNITPHLEVETYTWNVLPPSIRPDNDRSMITGIKAELDYVKHRLQQLNLF